MKRRLTMAMQRIVQTVTAFFCDSRSPVRRPLILGVRRHFAVRRKSPIKGIHSQSSISRWVDRSGR